jgi:hypothetical protein
MVAWLVPLVDHYFVDKSSQASMNSTSVHKKEIVKQTKEQGRIVNIVGLAAA